MATAKITIQGQQIDYEAIKKIPLSFTKGVDKFLEGVGGLGDGLDGMFKTLRIPATKNNLNIIDNKRTLLDIKVVVGGSLVFMGKCKQTKKVRSHIAPKYVYLELIGGGGDPISQLSDVSLRNLDLGNVGWYEGAIRSSWEGTFDTGYNYVYALVLYGTTHNFGLLSGFTSLDVRPSVRFIAIFKAIIETHLGYRLVSDFIDNDPYFKEWIYHFGVGEDWQISANIDDYKATGQVLNTYTCNPNVQFQNVRIGENEIEDTAGGLSLDKYVIQYTGVYRIYGKVEATERIDYSQLSLANYVTNFFDTIFFEGDSIIHYDIELFLEAGTNVFIQTETTAISTGLPTVITNQSIFNIELLDKVHYGMDIRLASCLHDRPVKDFIKAICHMTCGALEFNTKTKVCRFEPRFKHEHGKGFYFTPVQHQANETELNYTMELNGDVISYSINDKLGKDVVLRYAEDDNDPLLKIIKNKGIQGLPIHATRTKLTDRGVPSKVLENPLFTPLAMATGNIPTSYKFLPAILPSSYVQGEEIPVPTYQSAPKCSIYAGLKPYEWAYWGVDDTIFDPVTILTQRPISYQQPSYLDDNTPSMAYATKRYGNFYDNKIGLTDKYWQQYFSIMRNSDVLNAKFNLHPQDVAALTFRRLWRVDIKQNVGLYVLLKIANFKPLEVGLTDCQLIEYKPLLKQDFDLTEHSGKSAYVNLTGAEFWVEDE